jgi:ribosome biogenesis GTPase
MTRDYSRFFSPGSGTQPTQPTRPELSPLAQLGWQPFFAQQIDVAELERTPPVRIVEVHRNALHVMGDGIDTTIPLVPDVTVGDWLLLDRDRPAASRCLDRKSLIKRRAPGTSREVQKIAANLDTVFVVSSCNHDFNLARLERYVAVAFEAEVAPVIVLTKADEAAAPETYADRARGVSDRVPVVVLDARGDEPKTRLAGWCRPGQTVAFLGSSGVGKSTLTNALAGAEVMTTSGIRADDSKGRHTTTRRQLHMVPGGCLVLDTPGMRELQLTDAASGIEDVFADIAALAERCRFRDCRHETEPGCAVLAAVERGHVEPARLDRWRKLMAEEARNSASLRERRARDKAFGKMVREVTRDNAKRNDRDP